MKPRARFGIGLPHGEMDHEWEQLERAKPVMPVAHDNGHEPETLLYGPRGEALIVSGPRPVGFRQDRRS